MTGEFGEERADHGAGAGQYRLDGHRQVVDPAHHLDVLADDVCAVGVPVGFVVDEEGAFARVPVGGLDHQFVAEPGRVGLAAQRAPVTAAGQHVWHRGDPGLVAQTGGDDLRIQSGAQFGRWQDQVVAQLIADHLRFLVAEDLGDLRTDAGTAGYLMHIVESASHQLPLAVNVVRDGDSWVPDGSRRACCTPEPAG
ncbi:hypothetical protein ADIAG_01293 [Paeniglutamicibacter gangotriensis Lz1y]|uniref:Uncharacterized protein n=1 Tax=Paeniglutamicibacter gangotriensis Lz1y TaxID=1276920 RepID=M7MWI6_9MICC|nr:hypothetical protein ADIAG_01293 [Paeniglutamicibacter gangotriensis Lz1y]